MAIPAELTAVREEGGLRFGSVRVDGKTREIVLACAPDAEIGDHVLVHLGCAIARLDPVDAARRRALLDELAGFAAGELQAMLPRPSRRG